MTTFLGIDLGWFGRPTGVATITLRQGALHLAEVTRVEGSAAVLEWARAYAGSATIAAVDAPLVIPNATGIRPCERDLNRDFHKFHAGCHPANLGRPFAENVLAFAAGLEALGFEHGRTMIEVHPHAASVRLFGLSQIVKYKRGLRAERAAGLRRLRTLMLRGLPALDPPFAPRLPAIPRAGPLKPAEDQIDAVLCAYLAAHWWRWGRARTTVYGDRTTGYVVVPNAPPALS